MKITELSLKRPSLMTVIFLSLFILGLYSYGRLPADLLPRMDFPYVAVMVPYPGAGPEDVERKVTKPLEDAMSSLNNLDDLYSFSQEGLSAIWIGFKMDTDTDVAVNEVQRKYNAALYDLPPDIEPGTIQQFSLNDIPIVQMSVSGNLPEAELYDLVKNELQPQLQQVKGVSRVMLLGGREREIRLEVQPERLEVYKISFLQLMMAVQGDNKNVPAGRVEQSGKNFMVRIKSQVSDPRELEEIIVGNTPTGPVYLRNVARVKDTLKDAESIVRLNGQTGIGLMVFKRSDANTIETSEKIRKSLTGIGEKFGVSVAMAYDSSDFIKEALEGIQEDLLLAVLVVAFVIFLFLRSLRGSLVILLSIPVSLVSTLIFVQLFGFSVNLMTLLGAALVVGIVVDDSIVVLENIYRHMEQGEDPVTAAIHSSREIGVAVVGISLTLVVVFLPVALISGITGEMFKEFALVVVSATLLSLMVAITLIPMLASRWTSAKEREGTSFINRVLGGFERFLGRLSKDYEKSIRWALNHKKAVIAIAVLAFMASGALIPLRMIKTEFIPKVDRGEFVLKLVGPPGTSTGKMDSIVKGMEDEIRALPEIKDVFTSVGYATGQHDASASGNVAEIHITLKESGVGKSEPVKQKAEAIADRRAGIESSIVLTSMFGGAEDAPLRLEVRGYNLKSLQKATEAVKDIVSATPGTRDIRTSVETGLPEYNIRVDRDTAAAHGILAGDVLETVGLYLTGKVVGKYSDGEDQYDVRLIADEESRNDTSDIPGLLLANRAGEYVRLGQVARFSQVSGLKKIERVDRQRVFVVSANLEGRVLGDVVNDVKEKLKNAQIPPDISVVFSGEQQMFEESMGDLSGAMLLSLIFVYLIMVAIFESFLLPLTIWLSVPLAMVGALLSLALTGHTLNMVTMVGFIMLVGLVTKNAILLVDFANNLRKGGLSVKEALAQAGSIRLRPILMTTTAMVMAMLPLALGLSTGSEMRQGMSIALIGGLISSTCLTLFVVPVIYDVLESLKDKVRRYKSTIPAPTE
ncbi:MAG: efflux RND transporter permease subunit [Ammonifex sp.]|nr:MAG: efflux RND transporter permease subunit [Ammonifex sp.]